MNLSNGAPWTKQLQQELLSEELAAAIGSEGCRRACWEPFSFFSDFCRTLDIGFTDGLKALCLIRHAEEDLH